MKANAQEANVAAVMTPSPIVLSPDAPLSLAASTMAHHSFRHLPVVDGDAFVGIVSERDLLAARGAEFVREVMTTECAVTTPETPAAEAAEALLNLKIGCLPVLDEGALVGIVTETDFVRVAYAILSAVGSSVSRNERAAARREATGPAPAKKRARTTTTKKQPARARPATAKKRVPRRRGKPARA